MKPFSKLSISGLSIAAALCLALLPLPGCGGNSPSSFCEELCRCEGCSDVKRADCVDKFEDQAKLSQQKGCTKQNEAYFNCINSEFQCLGTKADYDGCELELSNLNSCIQ